MILWKLYYALLYNVFKQSHLVHVEYKVEVKRILSPEEVKQQNLSPDTLGQGDTEQGQFLLQCLFKLISSPVGSLCHTPGVVRRTSSVVCRLCPP